jgi:hypothetical protein
MLRTYVKLLASYRRVEVKYYRVYADDNGDSHSEEVAVAMSQADFAPPAPAVDLSSSIHLASGGR